MTARAPDEAPDRTYFSAIEEEFVRLRGAPLILSPSDWHLAAAWHRQGIPLTVVLNAIRQVMESAASRGRRKPVLSLSYCRHEVEAEYGRYLEAAAGHGSLQPADSGPSLGQRLEKKAVRLGDLAHEQPALAGAAAAAAEALRQAARDLDQGAASPDDLERRLVACERDLLDRLQDTLPAEELANLVEACRQRLAPYRPRMATAAYESTLRHACDTALRRRFGTPRLSLLSD